MLIEVKKFVHSYITVPQYHNNHRLYRFPVCNLQVISETHHQTCHILNTIQKNCNSHAKMKNI